VDERTMNRAFAACGIILAALIVIGIVILGNSPSSDSSAEKISAFFTDNRTRLLLFAYVNAFAIIPAVFFWGGLWRLLRRAEGGEGALALIAFGSAVLAGAVVVVGTVGEAALAYRIAGEGDQQLTRAVFDMTNLAFNMSNIPLAAFFVAAGLVILHTGVLPRWLGWAALPAAAVQLLGAATFAESGAFMPSGGAVGLLAGVVLLLWTLAASVAMFSRAQPRAQTAAGVPEAAAAVSRQ
jgi:hypothetical protein